MVLGLIYLLLMGKKKKVFALFYRVYCIFVWVDTLGILQMSCTGVSVCSVCAQAYGLTLIARL